MRVVSLLPSTTEILFAIGAGDDVVGVTFECDFPSEARTRRIVSNTTLPHGLSPSEIDTIVKTRMAAGEDLYSLDEGALSELDADLVVTQDLCAVCAVDVKNVDDALAHLGCRAEVLTIDPMTLEAVLDSINVLGRATGRDEEAAAVVTSLRGRLAAVRNAVEGRKRPRVALLEWTDPLFCGGHWVPDLVEAAGATSVIGAAGAKSYEITRDDVLASQPDIVVVSPCGFRLEGSARLAEELLARDPLPDHIQVWAVDADADFVRPGPRLVDGVETLAAIAHPDLVAMPEDAATRLQ
jgi:iron complex transport system substrate-binding protein